MKPFIQWSGCIDGACICLCKICFFLGKISINGQKKVMSRAVACPEHNADGEEDTGPAACFE